MNSSLLSVFSNKSVLLAGMATGLVELLIVPKPMLVLCLIGSMILDLLTGLLKSWKNGQATTSSGFRKTVTKTGTYVGVILGMYLLATMLNTLHPQDAFSYIHLVNGTISFLVFIELYSIFENAYEIDPNSFLSKYLIKRVLKFLKGNLENNHPIKNVEDDEKQD